jgi:hypothetical protein
MYSQWAKVSKLPVGGSTSWVGSGLVATILRSEAFGPTGPNYLPNGGKFITLTSDVVLASTTNIADVVRMISDGTFYRGYPVSEDRILVLRDGLLHAEQGPW